MSLFFISSRPYGTVSWPNSLLLVSLGLDLSIVKPSHEKEEQVFTSALEDVSAPQKVLGDVGFHLEKKEKKKK